MPTENVAPDPSYRPISVAELEEGCHPTTEGHDSRLTSDSEDEEWEQRKQARIRPGHCVLIHSLVRRPELNDCLGDLVQFYADSGRWQVRMVVADVFIKPYNVIRVKNR